MRRRSTRRRPPRRWLVLPIAAVAVLARSVWGAAPQREVDDAALERASGGRAVTVAAPGGGSIATVPLEVYVSRVLAGEAEPSAPAATLDALAVAVRTFAVVNTGRHRREGFDLCDSTHCQVPRAASADTRRAASATAGQILTYEGAPAEVFYSASCGGRSESAAAVWPGASFPYLRPVEDDVHADDEPWTVALSLARVEETLRARGFTGSLRDVDIDGRTASGRVARLRLSGLEPDVVGGDQFRLAMGAAVVRSTAFDLDRRGRTIALTGRGYGHGVGMCVIGAARRARRGESAAEILRLYYPGLEIATTW